MKFVPFIGVVEDIDDPVQVGRVRARAFDYHTSDRAEIPTNALPWALVMSPSTSAGISHYGHSPSGLLPGSWVIGLFLDGERAQEPLILGSIPSVSAAQPDTNEGFSDPAGKYPDKLGHDTSEMARGNDPYRPNISTDILAALMTNNFAAQYPHNKVFETPSGHFKEYDDTKGAARIREQHKSGTHYEITELGDHSNYIVSDRYTVIEKNDEIHVKGKVNIIIDGDADITIRGSLNADVAQTTKLTCPSSTVDGELTVTGDVRIDGDVSVGKDVKTDKGISHNNHKHLIKSGSSAGLTDKPS